MSSKTPISQRVYNEAQYIDVRAPWLRIERIQRRILKIIISRPPGYDNNPEGYAEIWPDGVQEIWDMMREYNIDEIPFVMELKSKQIVRFGEQARLSKNNIQYLNKYRQGTLTMCINFKEIIFKRE